VVGTCHRRPLVRPRRLPRVRPARRDHAHPAGRPRPRRSTQPDPQAVPQRLSWPGDAGGKALARAWSSRDFRLVLQRQFVIAVGPAAVAACSCLMLSAASSGRPSDRAGQAGDRVSTRVASSRSRAGSPTVACGRAPRGWRRPTPRPWLRPARMSSAGAAGCGPPTSPRSRTSSRRPGRSDRRDSAGASALSRPAGQMDHGWTTAKGKSCALTTSRRSRAASSASEF
jgi:hypothetical protein